MAEPAMRHHPRPRIRSGQLVPAPPATLPSLSEVMLGEGWDTFLIHIDNGLPPDIDTLQVLSMFEGRGVVTNVRCFAKGKARVQIRWNPSIQPLKSCVYSAFIRKRIMNGDIQVLSTPRAVSVCIRVERLSLRQISSPKNESEVFPEKLHFLMEHLTIGMLSQADTIMRMYDSPGAISASKEHMEFSVDLRNRCLNIIFYENMPQTDFTTSVPSHRSSVAATYKIRIFFPRITAMTINFYDDDTAHVLIHLEVPPKIFRRVFNIDRTHDHTRDHWNEDLAWFRQTEIVMDERAWEASILNQPPVALRKPRGFLDVGRWTTYLLRLKANGKDADLNSFIAAMKDFNVPISEAAIMSVSSDTLLDLETERFDTSTLTSLIPSGIQASLPFEVHYQLDACISHNCLSDTNIDEEFLTKLSRIDVEAAVSLLETVESAKTRVFTPKEIFEELGAVKKQELSIPSYCNKMRRVTVTPTTMYISAPSVELSNRVLRQYKEHLDRFLRVQFMDEKFEGKLFVTDKTSAELLLKRVATTLQNGIRIGHRHYEFLAFGNSQFRENGAYFFSPTDQVTCGSIREWMGEFTHIRVIAKYCARLGQCFSTTRAIGSVKAEVVTIPDIERNGFCFSDGVGLMSPFLSDMIAHELSISKSGSLSPSAYQFRLGGCKGVLAVSQRLKGRNQLRAMIRPSQRKFDASAIGLEVNRVALFCSASLNRQLILILSALGVVDNIFISKLKQMLENLEIAMTDEGAALEQLCRSVDHNRTSLFLAGLVRAGFMKIGEPFVLTAMHLWKSWSIKYLKEKARIIVKDGAFLLGVVDDSGASDEEQGVLRGYFRTDEDLNEGRKVGEELLPEIFVQITDSLDPSNLRVIQGRCIVARNPSLHPGDIRVVNAVDRTELHHHLNVVVFPRNGDRDIPGMCSGGDLDGDDFIVIWDQDFMPDIVNYPPMDYSAPRPIEKDGDVTADDMMNFFLNYMKNDRLGHIANCHLVWADRYGALSAECKELARLHSKAVDFNKTGEPAELPRRLRVREFPHFMEKRASKTYKSHNILGKLYDMVDRVEFSPIYSGSFDERLLYSFTELQLRPWFGLAYEMKQKYDNAVQRVMSLHEIGSELEVFTGFVLHHSAEKNDYKYHEEIGNLFQSIRDSVRVTVFSEIAKRKGGDLDSALFVSASYLITCGEIMRYREAKGLSASALQDNKIAEILAEIDDTCSKKKASSCAPVTTRPFISFPWIFPETLIRISNGEFNAYPNAPE